MPAPHPQPLSPRDPETLRLLLLDVVQRVEDVVNRTLTVLETADEAMARRTLVRCRRIHQDVLQIRAPPRTFPSSPRVVAPLATLTFELEKVTDLAASLCQQAILQDETGIVGDTAWYRLLGEDVIRTLRSLAHALQGIQHPVTRAREDDRSSERTVEGVLLRMALHADQAVRTAVETCGSTGLAQDAAAA